VELTKMQIRPEIRFKEFTEEIPLVPMAKLGNFIGGGTPDKEVKGYWKGDIPWISSSDIEEDNIDSINISRHITEQALKESATKLISANSLLFVSRVGVGKLAVNKTALCTSQDFTNFIPSDMVPHYVAYFFQKNRNLLNRYSQGTSIKGLTSAEIKKIKITAPYPVEQQKIADFLSSVDKKISLLKEKHTLLTQYKKGAMQKLFKQEIRFKDDNGNEFTDWQEFRLSDVLNLILNPLKMEDESDYELITVRRRNGGVDSRGIYKGKEVLVKTQFELKENQFVISKRQIVHGACGIVPAELEGAIVSNEYNVFEPVSSLLDVNFFNLFSQTKYMRRAYFINSDGVHIEKLLFKTQSWLKTKVTIPSLEEQQKIVGFVQTLDKKLQAISEQIELTQTFKKGLLQQMFV